MVLTFWGVRAATPVPGPATTGIGGNTVCLDIACEDSACRAVIDAGTGIIMLGKRLLAGPCGKGRGDIHIFLTHTHWDHIQGFPFFVPAFIAGNRITFHGRSDSENPLREILDGQMRAEYNPIQALDNMGSTIVVEEFDERPVSFGPFTMQTRLLPHRGEMSLGYRIGDGRGTAVLLGDVHHGNGMPESLVAFAAGADLLVHDAGDSEMPVEEELHAAVRLARESGARRLLFTHFAPGQTNDDVARLVATARRHAGSVEIDAAREGSSVTI